MAMTEATRAERAGGRRWNPWVVVAIVFLVLFFVLPLLLILAIQLLGTEATTEFSQIGSPIG
jgi:uncharacterized membrane protein (DUF485 family)